jgi:hypothetical protein
MHTHADAIMKHVIHTIMKHVTHTIMKHVTHTITKHVAHTKMRHVTQNFFRRNETRNINKRLREHETKNHLFAAQAEEELTVLEEAVCNKSYAYVNINV